MMMNDTTKKLIELLDNFPYELSDYIGDNKHFIVDNHIELAKYLVSNSATIQKYGHWIQDDEYDICSVCNNPVIMNRLRPDRWCKNCGAKMDGGN